MKERPIECSKCKKDAKITYKTIIDGTVVSSEMCVDCPLLRHKIPPQFFDHPDALNVDNQNVTCDNCKTHSDNIIMGQGMGCINCYHAFEHLLINQLAQADAIPLKPKTLTISGKQTTLHIGKSPKARKTKKIFNKLESLNTALSEALGIENYELAANLRDQIKILLEESNEK